MEFKTCLESKGLTAYRLSKETGIPYSCIADLCTNKTATKNLTLEKACAIAAVLGLQPVDLLSLKPDLGLPLRYFRNNVLHHLKAVGDEEFIEEVLRKREIDMYYKNGDLAKALYVLALVDYLCIVHRRDICQTRYNFIRKTRLDKPCFVGGNSIGFKSIEDAEKALGIPIIPEFAKYNIIEVDICVGIDLHCG